jgi:hypothetical protein
MLETNLFKELMRPDNVRVFGALMLAEKIRGEEILSIALAEHDSPELRQMMMEERKKPAQDLVANLIAADDFIAQFEVTMPGLRAQYDKEKDNYMNEERKAIKNILSKLETIGGAFQQWNNQRASNYIKLAEAIKSIASTTHKGIESVVSETGEMDKAMRMAFTTREEGEKFYSINMDISRQTLNATLDAAELDIRVSLSEYSGDSLRSITIRESLNDNLSKIKSVRQNLTYILDAYSKKDTLDIERIYGSIQNAEGDKK